jgi:pimeloyl-ACP methyl ester carboxylesterase
MKRTSAPLSKLLCCCLLLAVTISATARAEEIQSEFRGLTLNASLELAEGKDFAGGMVLIAHAFLQHHRMELVRNLQDLLLENGFSSLAFTFSAGLDDRRGPYDCAVTHRHSREGDRDEITHWLGWLQSKGSREVVLIGHSAGGNRFAYFMAYQPVPEVSKMVLTTPGTGDHSAVTGDGYRARYGKELAPIVARAQSLVDQGRGDEIMQDVDFTYCPAARVSAHSFVSLYGKSVGHRLFPQILPRLEVPTLIIGATEDNIAPDMEKLVTPFVDGERIRLVMIEGASHFLRDLNLEDAVDEIVAFLDE